MDKLTGMLDKLTRVLITVMSLKFCMRQLALEARKQETVRQLNWIYYRILFGVADRKKRVVLLQRVILEQPSVLRV